MWFRPALEGTSINSDGHQWWRASIVTDIKRDWDWHQKSFLGMNSDGHQKWLASKKLHGHQSWRTSIVTGIKKLTSKVRHQWYRHQSCRHQWWQYLLCKICNSIMRKMFWFKFLCEIIHNNQVSKLLTIADTDYSWALLSKCCWILLNLAEYYWALLRFTKNY